jgi:hypothetical protein
MARWRHPRYGRCVSNALAGQRSCGHRAVERVSTQLERKRQHVAGAIGVFCPDVAHELSGQIAVFEIRAIDERPELQPEPGVDIAVRLKDERKGKILLLGVNRALPRSDQFAGRFEDRLLNLPVLRTLFTSRIWHQRCDDLIGNQMWGRRT